MFVFLNFKKKLNLICSFLLFNCTFIYKMLFYENIYESFFSTIRFMHILTLNKQYTEYYYKFLVYRSK